MRGGAADSQRLSRERSARAKKQTGVVGKKQQVRVFGKEGRIVQNSTGGTVPYEEMADFSAELGTLNSIEPTETYVPSVQRNSLRIGCGPVGF